jgi:hypothetical protein
MTVVDVPIPSWRVATRQRHFDLTSPLRLARKLLASDADVTLGIADNEHSRPATHSNVHSSEESKWPRY